MAIIGSLLLGMEGSYNCGLFNATFVRPEEGLPDPSNVIIRIAKKCMECRPLQILSLGYLHVFIHEAGHAIVDRILTGKKNSIEVDSRSCTGFCVGDSFGAKGWKRTAVLLAGPAADITFSIIKIIAAVALVFLIPSPFSLIATIPIALILAGGGITWICGELGYAITSAIDGEWGDFGGIREEGPLHLTLATAAVVSQLALGVLASTAIIVPALLFL